MAGTFDPAAHERLVAILAQSSYMRDCIEFAARYPTQRDVEGPRMDLTQVQEIFKANGVACKFDKRFKVFLFDEEEVCGWRWLGSLVVQRYDGLEPMMEGESKTTSQSVGSTLLSIAADVARLTGCYEQVWRSFRRPEFDGDMRTMERMVPDLVRLFRSMKDVIRQRWDAPSQR